MLVLGFGFDSHELIVSEEKGAILRIGGVDALPGHRFRAHSDGDPVLHALIDAIAPHILGKNIGELFPDTDMAYYRASSAELLAKTLHMCSHELSGKKVTVLSVDCTVVCDRVKITQIRSSFIDNMNRLFPGASIVIKGKRSEQSLDPTFVYAWVAVLMEMTPSQYTFSV